MFRFGKKNEKPSASLSKYCDHSKYTVIERENSNHVKNLFIKIYANLYFMLLLFTFTTFHCLISIHHSSLVSFLFGRSTNLNLKFRCCHFAFRRPALFEKLRHDGNLDASDLQLLNINHLIHPHHQCRLGKLHKSKGKLSLTLSILSFFLIIN